MIGIKHSEFRKFFFDSKTVMNSVDKATRTVLSKFGAFVRTTAKQSIKTRRQVSKPGQPPSSHTGLLKKFIYFGFDPGQRSVVIGPTLINNPTGAPENLEHGGTAVLPKTRWRKKAKQITIKRRPFMGPAFEKEKPKLPAMWANSVK
jgi:hypothetical protein